MGNYHAPFWRAVEVITPSLTLILAKMTVSSTVTVCGQSVLQKLRFQ